MEDWKIEKLKEVYEDYCKGDIDLDEFNLRCDLIRNLEAPKE